MKKKNQISKLTLKKKTITQLSRTDMVKGGAALSINICPVSRRDCEPSWDTGCLSHLSGCALCPSWPTACEM
ncbi:hypothetical protein [Taibaiella chishuiensis]|uniref:Uncharacterized protein n=1 Tax=Taibaiella chishuiensis TaxID=1434707 RepID=A0A2P8D7W0_9BACT|nr:hypothetical protein [Taibaiella chishuiensis]PSK93320.1 hypothetical protein B0I18_102290 [Taibaiella chishuiensis]